MRVNFCVCVFFFACFCSCDFGDLWLYSINSDHVPGLINDGCTHAVMIRADTHTHTHTYIIILLSHFCWCFVLWWFVPRQRSSPGASSFVALFFFSFLFFNIGKSPLCNASSLVLLHLVFVFFFFRAVILALFLSAPGCLHLCLCGKKKIIIYLLRSEEVEERSAGTRKQPSWIIKRKKKK